VTGRRPGDWPVAQAVKVEETDDTDEQGEQHLAVVRTRARFQVTLGAIRGDLDEQPSDRSIRSAAKRWHKAITELVDEVIAERRRTG
jgi:hypothetical protein